MKRKRIDLGSIKNNPRAGIVRFRDNHVLVIARLHELRADRTPDECIGLRVRHGVPCFAVIALAPTILASANHVSAKVSSFHVPDVESIRGIGSYVLQLHTVERNTLHALASVSHLQATLCLCSFG